MIGFLPLDVIHAAVHEAQRISEMSPEQRKKYFAKHEAKVEEIKKEEESHGFLWGLFFGSML